MRWIVLLFPNQNLEIKFSDQICQVIDQMLLFPQVLLIEMVPLFNSVNLTSLGLKVTGYLTGTKS